MIDKKTALIPAILLSLFSCTEKQENPPSTESIYSTDSSQEDCYTYEYDSISDTYAVVSVIEDKIPGNEMRIPVEHNGKKVMSLTQKLILTGDKIDSVVFPEEFTSINNIGSLQLKKIVLPKVLDTLYYGSSYDNELGSPAMVIWPEQCNTFTSFTHCPLTEIRFPEGMVEVKIPSYCHHLASITIPSTARKISFETDDQVKKNLYEVYNLSETISDETIKKYIPSAKVIHHSKDEPTNIITKNDIVFYQDNDITAPLAYFGYDDVLIFPDDVNGRAYSLQNYAIGYYTTFPRDIVLPEEIISTEELPFWLVLRDLNFYCEPKERPETWKIKFASSNFAPYGGSYDPSFHNECNVYWGDEWNLVNGKPALKNK